VTSQIIQCLYVIDIINNDFKCVLFRSRKKAKGSDFIRHWNCLQKIHLLPSSLVVN